LLLLTLALLAVAAAFHSNANTYRTLALIAKRVVTLPSAQHFVPNMEGRDKEKHYRKDLYYFPYLSHVM
jgi:hypothetical protein